MSRTYRNTIDGEKIRRSKDFERTRTGFLKYVRAVDFDGYNRKSRRIVRNLLRNGAADIHVDIRRQWIN